MTSPLPPNVGGRVSTVYRGSCDGLVHSWSYEDGRSILRVVLYDARSDSLLDLGDRAHGPWYTGQRTACRSRFSLAAVCHGTQAARPSAFPVRAI